ncbi:MAG: signal peptidase II [Gammaproteobacteria bacterium]|nr:signal peptidase II [Gammaproteobacteria bacterium]
MNRLSITSISFLVLIDYISKLYIKELVMENSIIVNNYIILEIYYNKGVAFSFLDSSSLFINYSVTFIVAVIILVIFSLFIKNYKNYNTFEYSSYILILGGALGNFLDRLLNNSVLDFIIIHYDNIYFPGIFNLADMFITIGALLLFLSYFTNKERI